MRRPPEPTRALVDLVLEIEAKRCSIPTFAIIESKRIDPSQARYRVWREVMRLSGCSVAGLARVWGIDRQAIWRVQKPRKAA